MIEIQLTRGYVALIDDADIDVVSGYKWYATPGRNTFYAVTSLTIGGRRATMRMHSLLMLGKPLPGRQQYVDHIDRNGLNNQRANLRLVNHSVNQQNGQPARRKSVPYKGVFFDRHRYRALISKNKRKHSLGCYETAKEAALAYDRAALEMYGPGAFLNFPEAALRPFTGDDK